MTISTHVYAAVLQGTPTVALAVKGGTITLDERSAPHVVATLNIAIPSLAVLARIDTRLGPRIVITATSTSPFATQTRSFNLTLRDRRVEHRDAVVSLTLSSDEGLLEDYAPMADDETPYVRASSGRSLVNYVLGKAIPGATLQATPSIEFDATPYANATNLITDPSNQGDGAIFTGTNLQLEKNETTWSAHGTKSINLYNPTAMGAWMNIGGDAGALRMGLSPGREYVFSATGRVKAALSGSVDTNARRLVIFWRNAAGVYESAASPALPTTVGAVTRISVRARIPEGSTEAFLRVYLGHSASTSQIQYDAFRLSEYTGDPSDTAYWDGSSTETAGYSYAWTGSANNSTSRRVALIPRSIDSLLWRTGTDALSFLATILQAAGLRIVCDELRRWTLRNEDYSAPGALTIRHGVNLIDGSDTTSRTDDEWFDACAVVYTWIDRDGNQQTATDAYALQTPYVRLLRIERDAPYPGPGLAQHAVRRAQGRGREVKATCVTDWSVAAEQPVSVVLLGAPTQVGQTSRVTISLDADEMTVTTRATDTPAGAIDLLAGTIDQLVGTIDNL